MRHNHWIGFDTLLPKTGDRIEYVFKNGDITSETVSAGVFEGVNRYKHVVLEGQRNTLAASLHMWRLDQNGWLLPCEVTGGENADYWVLKVSTERGCGVGVDVVDQLYLPRDRRSLLEAIIKGGVIAAKPMTYPKAPNWMLNRG